MPTRVATAAPRRIATDVGDPEPDPGGPDMSADEVSGGRPVIVDTEAPARRDRRFGQVLSRLVRRDDLRRRGRDRRHPAADSVRGMAGCRDRPPRPPLLEQTTTASVLPGHP